MQYRTLGRTGLLVSEVGMSGAQFGLTNYMGRSIPFSLQTHMSEERHYRSIFETARDGLIVHDVETGRVIAANPAAGAMHGYAREESIGLHPTTVIHPDSQPLFSEYIQAIQSGGVFQPLTVHVRRDGSPFHVEWRGTAFTYQGRRCLLSVVRDVSDRVQAERLLQQRVEARTREQSTLLEISHEPKAEWDEIAQDRSQNQLKW